MKKLIFIVLALSATSFAYGQSAAAKALYDEAKKLYDDDKYKEAITKFKAAIKKDDTYADAWYYMGLSYAYDSQDEIAVETFAKLEKLDPTYWAWYYYEAGKCLINLNRLDEAEAQLNKFQEKFPDEPGKVKFHHMAKCKLVYAKQSQVIRKLPKTMKDPVNMTVLNSVSTDYMPQVTPTGKKMYFTSTRKGGFGAQSKTDANDYGEDLYFTDAVDGKWGSPQLLPEPINSTNNDALSTFTADGQTLVYIRCNATEGIGSCDLYVATLEGDKWSQPLNMGNVVNSKEWDSQPTISSDGNRIIFTSQRDGGYGAADLYMIEKNYLGDWGIPMNLGSTINTPFTDKSPYLAPDGKSLYFSSYGHPGFGGADIFRSVFENGKWSVPVNLGSPLNSSGDDNYFTISASGEQAYFASTRPGGLGDYDLYEIEIPEELRPQPTVVVSGIVTNAKTKSPVGAWVLVEDINSGELIATNKSNASTGQYLVVLPAGRNYSVSANKEGFFFYSNKFEVAKTTLYREAKQNIELKPIEKGTKVVLNNIFFETGKANLTSDSFLELRKAVELMNANKTMTIEVGGHTDNVGSDDINMKLSHDRAKSVRDYLVKAGIASERIQAKGYGKTQPIASNDTPEGKQANRRTEFVILEF